jgi:hypothetical protein
MIYQAIDQLVIHQVGQGDLSRALVVAVELDAGLEQCPLRAQERRATCNDYST